MKCVPSLFSVFWKQQYLLSFVILAVHFSGWVVKLLRYIFNFQVFCLFANVFLSCSATMVGNLIEFQIYFFSKTI